MSTSLPGFTPLSALVPLCGLVLVGGCGLEIGDRDCTQLLTGAQCGDFGRLYFTEATDDPTELGGAPRPVAVGARYALRVGIEEYGSQGKDAGWVFEPRLLASVFARDDLFVVESWGDVAVLRAVEAGTETLFVGTDEATNDRIRLQAVEPSQVVRVLGRYSGAPPEETGTVENISESDVALLPGAWVEISTAAFDADFRALAGYGLAEWTVTPGLELETLSTFSDRVRVHSTGELGGLSIVEGGDDSLDVVFELVSPAQIGKVELSLVDAFGTGAVLVDEELRVLVERPVTVQIDAYSDAGRLVIPAEDTKVTLGVAAEDADRLSVSEADGVGRFVIDPISVGAATLEIGYAGGAYAFDVRIE